MTANDLSGGPRKTRRRKTKKTTTLLDTTDTVSSQAKEESNAVPNSDLTIVCQSSASSLLSTPKRGRGQTGQTEEACLTSTPVHSSSNNILSNISSPPPGATQVELEYTELITQLKVFYCIFTDKHCFCFSNPLIFQPAQLILVISF